MNDIPAKPAAPESEKLHLHIPPHREMPGQRPDFSYFRLPPAGSFPRPATDVPSVETHRLATELIRVLDDDGRALGEWDPKLDPETLRQGLRAMLLTRAYDDRMYRAQRTGKTSFYMKCTGEEAIGVAQAMALRPDDMLFPTYRQQGLLIARGYPVLDMMCQCYANARDPLKGRQLPVLYSSREKCISRCPAISAPSSRRRSAGRWPPPTRATPASPPAGSAKARPPSPISTTR